MASIMTAIQLQDNFSGVLYDVVSSVNLAIRSMSEMQQAVGADIDTSSLNGAQESIDRVTMSLNRMNSAMGNGVTENIRSSEEGQRRFNQEISTGVSHADSLARKIGTIAGTYLSIQGITGVLDASDELTQTTSRIDLMRQSFNEAGVTTQGLMDSIYKSAQDARGSFADMTNVVARFGNNAKDAFGSTEEVVRFANLIQKQLNISGATAEESASALLQLSQAMGSGVLRGEELNAVLDSAPNIIQNIADYLDVPRGQIKDMAADGQITASIVKQALFSAADEIDARIAGMPMTWAQLWQQFKDNSLRAFQPVLERINEIANSEQLQEFVNGTIQVMATLGNGVLNVFDLMGQAGSFLADNWSIISPIIYGVVAALAVYAAYLGIVKGIEIVSAVASAAMAVGKGLLAAATVMTTRATWAQATAQMGLNGAMYACPIVWIIALIIALIAIIYLVVAAINKVANTSYSAAGIICGVFATVCAVIGNIFITAANLIIDAFCAIWNFIAIFVNFLATAFNDPVTAIARLVFNLVDWCLSILQCLASAIDSLFGSNLADAVSGWRNKLGGWVDSKFGKGTEIMSKVDSTAYHFDRIEYGNAYNAGYKFGEGIDDKISNFNLFDGIPSNNPDQSALAYDDSGFGTVNNLSDSGSGGSSAADKLADAVSGIDNIAANTGSTAADTARIADTIDITDEDLKYLRDIAERDIIDRTVFTKVEVNMGGITNEVHGMTDISGIADEINAVLQEQISISAEG